MIETLPVADTHPQAAITYQPHTYDLDGVPLHTREVGVGRRQKLILIHGWSSSWFAMSPLLDWLGGLYHCIAVDLPGYGDTPRLAERTTIPAYATLIGKLIEQVSPGQPATLIGHSMGGMTSLTLALQRPELVERMVLICPTISGKLSTRIALSIAPITFLEGWSLTSKAIGWFEPWLLSVTDRLMRPVSFADRTTISDAAYMQLRADARRLGQGRVRAECYRAMQDNNLSGRLHAVTQPTLAIWGWEDNTVPLRDASVLDSEFPAADLHAVPNAGHWPHFESPVRTERLIRGFLAKPVKLLKAQF